ncbi:MAG: hypothetical protein WCO48_00670 [Candidatus Taylorbacteria bacterium]
MENYNINKLPTDGYLVFPLSMSRLAHGQSPEECYEMLRYFVPKIKEFGVDVIFLYTNGLYFNSTDSALEIRKRTNVQMLSHRNALFNLIVKGREFISQAIHFLPWDYAILDASRFDTLFHILKKATVTDQKFNAILLNDVEKRDQNDGNIEFLLEETVVIHLIREQMVSFPKTLVKKDTFRLIVYPGTCLEADRYQSKNGLLPRNDDCVNPYRAAHYDFSKKILIDFDKEV